MYTIFFCAQNLLGQNTTSICTYFLSAVSDTLVTNVATNSTIFEIFWLLCENILIIFPVYGHFELQINRYDFIILF